MAGLPPETPVQQNPRQGGSSTSWLAKNKKAATIGTAVAGVAAIAWYKSHHTSSSASSASGTTAANSAAPYQAGMYDSSALDAYNQLAGNISDLNDTLDSLQAQVNSLGTPTNPTTSPPRNGTPATNPNVPAIPLTGPGSASAKANYDQALQAYRAAGPSAPFATLQKLMDAVLGTQAAYTGTAGTAAARAQYDQALQAYNAAFTAKAPASTLAEDMNKVLQTQSAYLGRGV
jgi:hypothetical protein